MPPKLATPSWPGNQASASASTASIPRSYCVDLEVRFREPLREHKNANRPRSSDDNSISAQIVIAIFNLAGGVFLLAICTGLIFPCVDQAREMFRYHFDDSPKTWEEYISSFAFGVLFSFYSLLCGTTIVFIIVSAIVGAMAVLWKAAKWMHGGLTLRTANQWEDSVRNNEHAKLH